MNIIYHQKKLRFIQDMIYKVVSEYLIALENNFSFQALISGLDVNIFPSSDEESSGACCITIPIEKRIFFRINANNSEKLIGFIIAHEFAHLLFANMQDSFSLSGKAADGSTSFNAIRRVLPDGSIYGEQLEELVANYLAHYIVGRMHLSDENGQYARTLQQHAFGMSIIEALEKPHGTPLMEGNYIGGLSEKGNLNNTFWSCIIAYSFNQIVDFYDEVMGKEQFQHFNKLLEEGAQHPSAGKRENIQSILQTFLEQAITA